MFLVKWVLMMVHAKNYETVSTILKLCRKKQWPLFPDTLYCDMQSLHLLLVVCLVIIASSLTNVNSLTKSSTFGGLEFGSAQFGMLLTTHQHVLLIWLVQLLTLITMNSWVAMENPTAVSVKLFSAIPVHKGVGSLNKETISRSTIAVSTVRNAVSYQLYFRISAILLRIHYTAKNLCNNRTVLSVRQLR